MSDPKPSGVAAGSAWAQMLEKSKTQWRCESCQTMNDNGVAKCVACEAANPKAATAAEEEKAPSLKPKAPSSAGFSFSFGGQTVASTASTADEAPAPQMSFSFGGQTVSFQKAEAGESEPSEPKPTELKDESEPTEPKDESKDESDETKEESEQTDLDDQSALSETPKWSKTAQKHLDAFVAAVDKASVGETLVFSFGVGPFGALGLGDADQDQDEEQDEDMDPLEACVPRQVPGLPRSVHSVCAGSMLSAAATVEGDVYTWGQADHGALGR
ncbi:MAG: hypothetical protein MHM6MM_004727, partial [Cercozoa sp. M6MM]